MKSNDAMLINMSVSIQKKGFQTVVLMWVICELPLSDLQR